MIHYKGKLSKVVGYKPPWIQGRTHGIPEVELLRLNLNQCILMKICTDVTQLDIIPSDEDITRPSPYLPHHQKLEKHFEDLTSRIIFSDTEQDLW